MRVLIVAKTRRGTGACVGGITQDGRSVRLIAADAAHNEHAGLEYNVGEVWEIESAPDPDLIPPHVENIVVRTAHRLKVADHLEAIIRRFMPAVTGGPEKLFDGRAQHLSSGALFIAERTGLPARSTMFWVPDQPLQRDCEGKRIRYRYPTADGGRLLTFVGFQDPVESIPAGALLRVSLAHWWRPSDKPEEELRCHVQLSGWFLPPVAADVSPLHLPPSMETELERTHVRCYDPEKHGLTRARQVLKQVFGYADFQSLQADIVARVLQRQDTLVIMPTGGGKSLCYQLPALLFDGLTVVVSPLIALMQDQVTQLQQVAVPAAFLNHTLTHAEYVASAHRIRHGDVRLLFVAPETLLRPELLVLLEQSRLACLAVDEAHCISEWGHDFRPEYRQIQQVRQRFPQAVCIALTATATPRVREDIGRLLGIPAEGTHIASFNRPNLFLTVQPRRDGLGQTLAFLEPHRGQSGIVYCSTKKQVNELAAELAARGWPALPYHAGLEPETRRRNQDTFIHDDATIMVATVAFGMGINKSNVRFVLHFNLPKDIESYYQEIGRAGRDGLPANCLLLHNHADATTIRKFIGEGATAEYAGRSARLDELIRYAETTACRRGPLLAYFNETHDAGCGHCDNCHRTRQATDVTAGRVPMSQPHATGDHADLFERLRALRRQLAGEARVPAYVIFSDRVLVEMAQQLPRTPEQFLALNGVGEIKLARYGETFLKVIGDHCATLNPPAPVTPQTEPTRWLTAHRRHEEIGAAFGSGQSLDELAERFNIKRGTVLQNLERFFETGGKVDGGRLLRYSRLPEADRERVLRAFKQPGLERLAPVHEALDNEVPYDELHLLRLWLRCRQDAR